MNYKMLREISLIKSLKMNIHYFGWKSVLQPIIICSKNVMIREMKGRIVVNPQGVPAKLKLGFNSIGCFDEKNESSVWQNRGEIILKGTAFLGSGTKLSNAGTIVFGNKFAISGNTTIICGERIEFGESDLISWDCLFMDTDLHDIIGIDGEKKNINSSIIVGDRVWFGCRCTVTKGTVIENDNIIAANSGLHGKIHAQNCCIGNNGVVLKRNVTWKK